MTRLILEPTSTAAWLKLISEAEKNSGFYIQETLESYLVFLLQRFTNKPEISNTIVAIDYLHSNAEISATQQQELREVADKCLLLSGFFPEVATKRQVDVSYFVHLGKNSYYHLSLLLKQHNSLADLYHELCEYFVKLMDLLQCIRELGSDQLLLSPLQAENLWREAGSKHALEVLQKYSDAIPEHFISKPKLH